MIYSPRQIPRGFCAYNNQIIYFAHNTAYMLPAIKKYISLRQTGFLTAIFLLLAGCTVSLEQPTSEPLTPGELLDLAEDSSARGNYVIAAQNYMRLAQQTSGAEQQKYLLTATEFLLRGQHLEYAKKIVAQIDPDQLYPQDRYQYRLTLAQIAMFEEQPEPALQHLQIPDTEIPLPLAANWHKLRAQALNLTGNYLEAMREYVQLENFLGTPDAIRENHQQIWQTLNQLSGAAMQTLRSAPAPDILSGWLELGYLYKGTFNKPNLLQSQLLTWAQRYPDHPAQQHFIDELLTYQDVQLDLPKHIALLLPLSGNFAAQARAVQDGFLASYYSRSNSRYTPEIRIYDTTDDVEAGLEHYQQAINSGADIIIGPLHKPLVEAIAERGHIPVKTLALNYVSYPGRIADNFFQYGLLPEDEARQVAERAWLDGYNRALILTPNGEWGDRMLNTFQQHWQQLDGIVLETQRYDPSVHDFAAPVIKLLNIDESHQRREALQRLTGLDLKFEPRRRQDIDFIYIAAFPNQARQIRPQLKFYYAANVPVYSTSHVFSGETDTTQDRDMDGITFSDIPWVFTNGEGHQPNWKTFTSTWHSNAIPFKRLYAMGIDAYRLINQLNTMDGNPQAHMKAETGNLYLDEANRIHRQLLWARFKSGRPSLIDTASPPDNPS